MVNHKIAHSQWSQDPYTLMAQLGITWQVPHSGTTIYLFSAFISSNHFRTRAVQSPGTTPKAPHGDSLLPSSLCARTWEVLSPLLLKRQKERTVHSDLYLTPPILFVLNLEEMTPSCLVINWQYDWLQSIRVYSYLHIWGVATWTKKLRWSDIIKYIIIRIWNLPQILI